MNTKVSNRDNTRSINIKTTAQDRICEQAEIKCYFEASHVLSFSDELIAYKIPAEDITIDHTKKLSGVILIQYNENAPLAEKLIEDITNAFINFFENGPISIQNSGLAMGR